MRPKLLPPREHGAWAIMIVPYVVGAAVGVASFGGTLLWPVAAFPVVILLFISRPALMLLIRRRYLNGGFGEGAIGLIAGVLLASGAATTLLALLGLVRDPLGLLLLAVLGMSLFFLHLWRALAYRERSPSSELAGILMLTLTAPLAFFLATDGFTRECWYLWLLSALYFGSSVFYVRMKLRVSARKQLNPSLRQKLHAGRQTFAYLAFMLAATGAMSLAGAVPAATMLAFVPVCLYIPVSIAVLRPGASIMLEGLAQTVMAVIFGLMLTLAFTLWS